MSTVISRCCLDGWWCILVLGHHLTVYAFVIGSPYSLGKIVHMDSANTFGDTKITDSSPRALSPAGGGGGFDGHFFFMFRR